MSQARKRRAPAQDATELSEAESEPATQRRRISAAEDQAYGDGLEDTQGDSNQDQMVKNLVRLALASEYSRTPIRRSEINAKVLGSQTRQFKSVFALAQEQLRIVFGMEMLELPVREKITIQQKRTAAKSQSQGQKTSGAWILTSILPAKFRESDILPPPMVPTAETEAQYTAFYTYVIALIMLSGGSLPDSKLERHNIRAGVSEVTPFTQSGQIDKTEKLLKKMEAQGYIIKVKDNSGGEETVDWIVGPRGKVEVGEQGVRGLARAVYGEVHDPEDFERRLERSLGVLEARNQDEGREKNKRGRKRKDDGQENDEEEEADDDVNDEE